MKRIQFLIFTLILSSLLLAQQQQNEPENQQQIDNKNIKMLTSEQEEEVKVEIRKPDDSSLMPRKETNFEQIRKDYIRQKIKKSNKMLY